GSEIAVIADHAVRLRNDPRTAQKILDVILRAPAGGQHGNAFAAEEDVFGRGVTRSVCFRQDFVPRAVPIKLTTGLVDPAAVAVPGCPGVTKNENRNSKNEIRPPRHPPGFVDLAAWGLAVVHELPVSLRLLVESEGRAHRCESGIDILLGE